LVSGLIKSTYCGLEDEVKELVAGKPKKPVEWEGNTIKYRVFKGMVLPLKLCHKVMHFISSLHRRS